MPARSTRPFRIPFRPFALGAVALALVSLGAPGGAASPPDTVLKATLGNGLRVVIVRNALAPVVSTNLTYLVGSRDDPADVPGMAHAQEHMMFRGTHAISTGALGTIATALGGAFNASTSDTLTQFEFTVPSSDLDAVLRIESDRMRDVLDAQSEWQNERGAIEQEVLHDETSPGGDYYRDAQAIAFAGTPYARQGVGTRAAFDRLTGPRIKAFYEKWYAPNNAVFVIAGDVDPAKTLDAVRTRFDDVPRRAVGAHPAARLVPIRRTVLRRPTTLVYPLASVGVRMPGIDSPDFVASYLLQQVLQSSRGPLRGLVDSGDALDGEWVSFPYVPEGQLAFATAALPPGRDPAAAARRLETIVSGFQRDGVPRELFETTKRQAISGQELSRNSIESLASDWATTIALDGEPSIAREQVLLANVTLADVNRVAKRYLDIRHAIVGELTPSAGATQNAPAAPQALGQEHPLGVQPPDAALPPWASELVKHPTVPDATIAVTRSTLPNGIKLVVAPETISDSVFVFGRVETQPALQEPAGKDGVSAILAGMYPYGTQSRDRAAFERAQDAIDTQVAAGSRFGVQTTSHDYDAAIALLAENELRPRFDDATFALAKRRAVENLATELNGTSAYAQRAAAHKLLPAGDPALREPTVDGLSALTLDDVRAYAAASMRPDLTTIVVVGNITPERARAALERGFAAWHATGDAPQLALPAVPLNAAADVKLTQPALGQDAVTLEENVSLARDAPDAAAFELGNAILGGGSVGPEQSRLFRDLRQNAGLVYAIDSALSVDRTRAQFSIDFACSPSRTDRIVSLVGDEVARMKSDVVGGFELDLMKASIVRRTAVAGASTGSIGGTLLGNASDGLPLDEDRRDARRILDASADDVRAAFAKYVAPDRFVKVTVGP